MVFQDLIWKRRTLQLVLWPYRACSIQPLGLLSSWLGGEYWFLFLLLYRFSLSAWKKRILPTVNSPSKCMPPTLFYTSWGKFGILLSSHNALGFSLNTPSCGAMTLSQNCINLVYFLNDSRQRVTRHPYILYMNKGEKSSAFYA